MKCIETLENLPQIHSQASNQALKLQSCLFLTSSFTHQKCLWLLTGYSDLTFLAGIRASTVTPPSDPIVFDDARINPGEHYDPMTGIYTAPLDGIYEFTVQIESNLESDNDWGFWVNVDGEDTTFTSHDASGSSSSNEWVSASSTLLVDLSAGQEVLVVTDLDSMHGSSDDLIMFSWFSGHLISAD